jgi:putative transposase
MPRQPREHAEEAIYHIRSRGNSKQTIFHGEADMGLFLRMVGECVRKFEWRCHAYCLMSNHYHMIIETPKDNISPGMHALNTRFAMATNRRYEKSGHLLGERYGSTLIQDDSYFLTASRYIVLNPVEAGLVEHPADWPWSNFNGVCGTTRAEDFLTTSFVLSFFADSNCDAREAYSRFVLDGLVDLLSRKNVPSLDELLVIGGPRAVREASICSACREHGYSHREVARHLSVHHTTIARILKRNQ